MNILSDIFMIKQRLLQWVLYSLLLAIPSMALSLDNIKQLRATCSACHGDNGVSSNPQWPNLAGQKQAYLAAQITMFRDGVRNNALMSSVVANLSDSDIDALATSYANQTVELKPGADDDVNPLGKNVRAYCISCHGVDGITVNGLWPNLAGQQKHYLVQQLLAYRNDERIHPIMQVIAKEINEAQIDAVAEYYSQLAK